jgi:hypothetical protein
VALFEDVRQHCSTMFARAGPNRVTAFAVSVALCVVMLPAIAFADDSAAIAAAMDSYYAGKVFTQIHWSDVQISEARPYAMFFAMNGESGVDDLLEEVGGRWTVVIPSKGVEEQDLLTSYRVPKLTAARLLDQCPPGIASSNTGGRDRHKPIDPSMYRAPYSYAFAMDGRHIVHSTVTSVRIPLQTLHFYDGHAERIDIAPAIQAQLCTPR